MYSSELMVVMMVGITLSLLFSDRFGIIPAGIIVPPFLALIFDSPAALAGLMLVALLAYVSVKFMGRFIILYGRRKFGAMILAALLVQFALHWVLPYNLLYIISLQGVGVIIPGLIANCVDRQGAVPTLLSMFFLGGLTHLALRVYLFWP
jgi:poly-gamma-glutamate biosynthesis protein PgsC/CapC